MPETTPAKTYTGTPTHCCLMMDKMLDEGYLFPTISFSTSGLQLLPPHIEGPRYRTELSRRWKNRPNMIVNFCPWCGKQLTDDEPLHATGSDGADGEGGADATTPAFTVSDTEQAVVLSTDNPHEVAAFLEVRKPDSFGVKVHGLNWRVGGDWLEQYNEFKPWLRDEPLHATGSEGAEGDAGVEVFPLGAHVVVEYMGAPGYIPRGLRNGVVVGHDGQYVVVDVEGCNLPKRYKADTVVAADVEVSAA